jgi:hypothetical protein
MLAEQASTGRPETIADIRWRLATIPVLELGILAMGSAEIIDANPDYWTKPENQTKLVLEARRRNGQFSSRKPWKSRKQRRPPPKIAKTPRPASTVFRRRATSVSMEDKVFDTELNRHPIGHAILAPAT